MRRLPRPASFLLSLALLTACGDLTSTASSESTEGATGVRTDGDDDAPPGPSPDGGSTGGGSGGDDADSTQGGDGTQTDGSDGTAGSGSSATDSGTTGGATGTRGSVSGTSTGTSATDTAGTDTDGTDTGTGTTEPGTAGTDTSGTDTDGTDTAATGTTEPGTAGTDTAGTDTSTDTAGTDDGTTGGSTDSSTDLGTDTDGGLSGASTDTGGDTGGGPGGPWDGDGDPASCGSDIAGWPGVPATTDACIGVTCNAAPADACQDADTLRVFEPAGTCNDGACGYRYVDVICDLGCSGGSCTGADCGGGGPCDSPPATSCFDNQTLRTYWPMGTCDAGSCDYEFWDIDCSAGCFGGACLLQSDLRAAFWQPDLNGDVQLRSRGSGIVERLVADGGTVTLEWPAPSGYMTAEVDSVLGTGNTAGFDRDSQGHAVVAYQVSNVVPNQLRLAWQDAPNAPTFAVEILEFSEGIAPAVVVTPADDVIVAYLAGDPLQLFVGQAPLAGGWATAAIDLAPDGMLEPDVQMLRDDDGTLHIVVADLDVAGEAQADAVYATGSIGGAWTTESFDNARISRRALGRNDAGDPELVYVAVAFQSQTPRNHARMVELSPLGSVVETIEGIIPVQSNASDVYFHVSANDGDVQVVSESGSGYWRIYANRWGRRDLSGETVQTIIDDPGGRPVFLGTSGEYVMPHACVPQCDGLSCGTDGCGGSCGQCSAGETCSTSQTCSSLRWEDIDVEFTAAAIHYDTTDDEFLLIDNGGNPATAVRGNTGLWELEDVGQEIFTLSHYGSDSTGDHHVVRYGFSDMFENDGSGWTQTESTPSDVRDVRWGPDGLLHAVYTREDAPGNETEFLHRTWNGIAWSAEDSLFTQETIISFVTEYRWDWDSNGDLHIVYGYWDSIGGGSFNTSIRHLRNTSGFWEDGHASSLHPQDLEFAIGNDDELHISVRPGGITTRHWVHKHLDDAAWVTEGPEPWATSPGSLAKSESGEVYFVAGNDPTFGVAALRQYDGTSDWPALLTVPDTEPTLAFGCPEPHFFATEYELQLTHRTHWW